MIVSRLELVDFRNYERAAVELVPGANLFTGINGQGKTNLVEAVGYLATLGSHRVSSDRALIRAGADAAIVRAAVEHNGREVLLELQLNREGRNLAKVNRAAAQPRQLPRYLSTVLFAPEDLVLVRGDPGSRRRFLDELLAARAPRLAGVLGDYDRALRQRTSLLKSAKAARGSELSTLEVWDERLVVFGSEIVAARSALLEELRPRVREAYRDIAGAEHEVDAGLRLSIAGAQPDDDDPAATDPAEHAVLDQATVAELFTQRLAAVRRQELERGLTLVGPHRDDLVLELNGLPARGFASHGESWSLALALRLASAAVLRDGAPGGDPVLVLDDVFAELDESRRERLAGSVADYEQVLVTAAVLGDVPSTLARGLHRIRAGRVLGDEEEGCG